MCDYSLQSIKSRPAVVGDKLETFNFGTGTVGFKAEYVVGKPSVAVCVLPGTELVFDKNIQSGADANPGKHKMAIFRQINKNQPHMHHDALELPDGTILLLTFLAWNQIATVLQLPAKPKTKKEAEAQKRVEFAG